MRSKILNVIFLFLLLSLSLFYVLNSDDYKSYRVLKICEADEFYLDLNKNNKADDNELVKLAYISAFSPIMNTFSYKQSQHLGIKQENYILNGYLARKWAQNNLLNKHVKVLGVENCKKGLPCNVGVILDGEDLAKILVQKGFAYLQDGVSQRKYYQYFDINQVINISKNLSSKDFVLYDLKNKIVHDFDCKKNNVYNSEVFLKSEARKSNIKFCDECLYDKTKYKVAKNIDNYKNFVHQISSSIDLYLINPIGIKSPNSKCSNDFCKRLIKEISSAEKSIDIALYGFGNQDEIFNELIKAKNRGVKIRVVMDRSKKSDNTFSNTLKFLNSFPSKVDGVSSLMHNKFFIFDDSVVFTGSVNISSSGSGGYNANNAVFIKDKIIAQIFKKQFEQMFEGKFSKNKISTSLNTNGEIEVYFSPKDNVYYQAFLPKIKNAKKTIYVSIFYLTEKNLINDLINAKKRGVEVLILIDALCASSFKERLNSLRNIGIPVMVENWGGKNHEKTMVIDDEILILGSSNFSKSGFYKNDENILVIKNSKLAKVYSDYFLYLFNSIDKKYLHNIPSAESYESGYSCFDGLDNDYDGKIDEYDNGCKLGK